MDRLWSAVTMVSVAMIFAFTTVIVMVVLVMAALAFVLAIFRYIDIVVPVVLHEIDGRAAGAIQTTMLAPVFRVAGWDVQIHRRSDHLGLLDDQGLVED